MKKERKPLDITFHDPNPPTGKGSVLEKLIEIAAQIAKANVEKQLLELAQKEIAAEKAEKAKDKSKSEPSL